MGIYISGVKGLPEQVQENKEKIATIEEEIEGIDFDAIHNLENQVAENTQDINNMEGTIGTQNIAITQLGGRVDDLEGKTQDITRQGSSLYVDTGEVVLNADLTFETESGSDIKLNPEDSGYSVNKIESTGNSNLDIHFNDSAVVVNSGGAEYEFINNTIQVNGTPIGRGGSDYITITYSGSYNLHLTLSTPKGMLDTSGGNLRPTLYSKGFNANGKNLACNGLYMDSNNTPFVVIGLYALSSSLVAYGYDPSTGAFSTKTLSNATYFSIIIVSV